jgi:hypothetical protein
VNCDQAADTPLEDPEWCRFCYRFTQAFLDHRDRVEAAAVQMNTERYEARQRKRHPSDDDLTTGVVGKGYVK